MSESTNNISTCKYIFITVYSNCCFPVLDSRLVNGSSIRTRTTCISTKVSLNCHNKLTFILTQMVYSILENQQRSTKINEYGCKLWDHCRHVWSLMSIQMNRQQFEEEEDEDAEEKKVSKLESSHYYWSLFFALFFFPLYLIDP